MKSIHSKIFLIILFISCISCDEYLDKLPDNRVELSRVSDIEGLLANALPDACFYSFTHSLSDNAGDSGFSAVTPQVNEEAFKFMDFASEGQDTPLFYWISCYEAIANTNLAIEFIEKLEENPTEYEKYKHLHGEALIARAYNHFMLVNLFSQHYNPNTANTDLGIPYVTEPEKNVLVDYKRGTVADVYKKILRDFKKGLPLLNDDKQQHPKFHFTTKSAHAFATRIYLYLGEWQKVVEHGRFVLGNDVTSKLRDWNKKYINFTASELTAHYASSKENANILIRTGMSNFAKYFKFQRFGLTAPIKEYVYNPERLVSKGNYSYSFRGYDEPDRTFINKFHFIFKRVGLNADLGYGYINNPLFTVEEVLLNYIEAKVMQERYPTVLRELNKFFSKRVDNIIVPYDPKHNEVTDENVQKIFTNFGDNLNSWYTVNSKQHKYLRCLLYTRRAEFMFEGLRWFDIKRYQLPVTHLDYQHNTYKLEANDLMKAIQIPESAIALGMEKNPRK